MRSVLIGLSGLLFAAQPAIGASKQKVEPALPPAPYSGNYQPQGVDEIGLWREDDERERSLANSPLVIRDPQLNAYVKSVFCNTVGADRCNSVRLYILRVPVFNASMSPNGTMRVFSGLLLRATSEAELGAVLGHEFGHFEKRHTLERFKAARRGSDLLSWAAILTATAGTRQAYTNFDSIRISVYGGLARFNRDHEREADLSGIGYLNGSQLRPHAASKIWRNFILETEASSAARGLKKPDFDRNSFFASHPAQGERVDYLNALALPSGASRDDGAERYAAALKPWMSAFLDDQIGTNDFGGSEFLINRLGEIGWTADLWRARGDLFRGRGHPRDMMNAADYYAKSVALDPNLAEAQRGLGLSLLKTGRAEEAIVALNKYLQLKPDAADAAMISLTIKSVGGD